MITIRKITTYGPHLDDLHNFAVTNAASLAVCTPGAALERKELTRWIDTEQIIYVAEDNGVLIGYALVTTKGYITWLIFESKHCSAIMPPLVKSIVDSHGACWGNIKSEAFRTQVAGVLNAAHVPVTVDGIIVTAVV